MLEIKGLATGIGSLPFADAEPALDLVFKNCSHIPFWPQLPKRDAREGMVAQFSEGIPCLEFRENKLIFNPKDKEKKLEIFYERIIAEDFDYFKITPDFAAGLYGFYQRLEKMEPAALQDIRFIKCHVTGPFTFAASINNDSGAVLLHDEVFMQVILKALAMKALWQIKLFKKFGKKVVVFLDEPYLGCFGSAFTPINKEQVEKGLLELTSSIRSAGVLAGVHCCGNTDWSIFTGTAGIDIINFDAFNFLDRLVLYAEDLKLFFKKGGMLCWGIVPTNEFNPGETAQVLAGKINDGIRAFKEKGLDRDLLLERMLLSPACGLGTLDQDRAKEILNVLSGLSALIRSTY